MRVKEYYLMSNKPALESMQAELSRLSDQWDGEDGSPPIDKDKTEIQQWVDMCNEDNEKAPF